MDLLIILLILIIPIFSSIYLRSMYSKYKKVESSSNLCGQEVASKILQENDLANIYVVETPGNLTDHYDSSRKTVRLSNEIFDKTTIASIAVAAHECGHAIQDKEGYFFMKLRSLIFPIVNFGTQISYIVIFIGALLEIMDLVYIGIALVSLGLIFQLITLPVEFDASKRALVELQRLELVNKDELDGAKKMLRAAALTYVAGVVATALDLLRLILIFTDNKRR